MNTSQTDGSWCQRRERDERRRYKRPSLLERGRERYITSLTVYALDGGRQATALAYTTRFSFFSFLFFFFFAVVNGATHHAPGFCLYSCVSPFLRDRHHVCCMAVYTQCGGQVKTTKSIVNFLVKWRPTWSVKYRSRRKMGNRLQSKIKQTCNLHT